jgi:hypothetical protein
MHLKPIYILVWLGLFSLCSCHALIDNEFPDYTPTPVLNATLITDSTLRIQVSLTSNLSDTSINGIENAFVKIECDGAIHDTHSSVGGGWYAGIKKVIKGKNYLCHVEIPGHQPIYATTYVPLPTSLSNLTFTPMAGIDEYDNTASSFQFTLKQDSALDQY